MSKLPPRKYLNITSPTDIENAKNLPLAVVLQIGDNVTVYKVDGKDSIDYFNAWDNPLMPSFKSVENATKRFGKTITREAFMKASVFPAQSGSHEPGNKEWAVYRARFEEETSKKSCDTQSGICK